MLNKFIGDEFACNCLEFDSALPDKQKLGVDEDTEEESEKDSDEESKDKEKADPSKSKAQKEKSPKNGRKADDEQEQDSGSEKGEKSGSSEEESDEDENVLLEEEMKDPEFLSKLQEKTQISFQSSSYVDAFKEILKKMLMTLFGNLHYKLKEGSYEKLIQRRNNYVVFNKEKFEQQEEENEEKLDEVLLFSFFKFANFFYHFQFS